MLIKSYIKELILKEQNDTKCLTSGAIFHTSVKPERVGIDVDIPFDLSIDEKESIELENLLHNAVELVLRPYFEKENKSNNFRKSIHNIRNSGKRVIAFDFHGTLVDVLDTVDKNGYKEVVPRQDMINKLINYKNEGVYIVIYTATPESGRDMIEQQLDYLNIPYDILEMDKPEFDIMYDNRFVGPLNDWV